jgi:hypothetical protein
LENKRKSNSTGDKMAVKPKIVFVGNLLTLPYSPDHAGIKQGLEELGLEYEIADPAMIEKGPGDFRECIKDMSPDVIIHGMTDSLSNGWIPEAKFMFPNVIQVFSMWDYRPDYLNYDGLWDSWAAKNPGLDLITLSNRDQLPWWAEAFNVETMYWPHGCYIGTPEFDKKYEYNTVFVGGRNESRPYDERVHLIDDINELSRVVWVNAPGSDKDPDRIRVWKDLGKIYHSAKTVLDVSHFWDVDGYASGRYFYTAGLGACPISKKFPNCEELYPEGVKIYFDTAEEAADKIKFYIEHETARNMVKQAAYDWTKKYHTYKIRFEELFKKLNIKI